MAGLRVLVLTPDFPPAVGGIQALTHDLVSHMGGVRARVLTLGAPGAAEWDAASPLDVRRVPAGRDRRAANLRLNARALAEARRFRPDAILAAHIVMAPAASVLRRVRRVPVALYLHAKEVPASPRLAAFAVAHADAIVAVSRYTAGLAAEVGADPARVHCIPPGVAPAAPSAERRRDRPTILTVARLEDRYKGHDVLLRALPLIRERVPDAEWVVVGDGPRRAELEPGARAAGLEAAVRFCGRVSAEERDAWLARAHVFAMPSRLPGPGAGGEGFGIVYLEAAAHGLPVVAGAVGGALDAVAHGESGLLVDPTSEAEVADAIASLLLDDTRRERMSEAAIRHAQRFAWPLVAEHVEALLGRIALLASEPSRPVRGDA